MPSDLIPYLDQGHVRRITDPPSDLTVVNAARVSFSKTSALNPDGTLSDKDARLIDYLVRNGHWTPLAHVRRRCLILASPDTIGRIANTGGVSFEQFQRGTNRAIVWLSAAHMLVFPCSWAFEDILPVTTAACQRANPNPSQLIGGKVYPAKSLTPYDPVTYHLKIPIFVARQLMRSNVGIVYNEVSRRYVDTPPQIHEPKTWRARPEGGLKQGSSETKVNITPRWGGQNIYSEALGGVLGAYDDLLQSGVAPEMARMVLPLSTYTELWATMTTEAKERVLGLRSHPHAQQEIRELAEAIRAADALKE